MPKLRKNGYEEKDKLLCGTVDMYRRLANVGSEELAAAACVCSKTYRSRFHDCGKMTLDELRAYRKKLNIPAEDLLKYIF